MYLCFYFYFFFCIYFCSNFVPNLLRKAVKLKGTQEGIVGTKHSREQLDVRYIKKNVSYKKKKKITPRTVLSLIFIPIISVLTDKEDQVFIRSLDLLLDILPLCNLYLGQGKSFFRRVFFSSFFLLTQSQTDSADALFCFFVCCLNVC